ncbi:MAG: hypothetical protein V3V81_08050 [Candidatus Bathyarchaeia archaeon]
MCCQGDPVEMASLMPEWMEEFGQDIIGYLKQPVGAGSRFTQPATALPEGFPLTSPVSPLSMGGADIMSQFMGSGQYQQPQPGSFNYQMPGSDWIGGDYETGIGDEPPPEPFDPDVGFGAGIPFERPPIMDGLPPEPPPPILPPIQPPQILPPEFMGGTSLPPFTHPAQPPSIIGQQYPIQQPNIGTLPWG